MNPQSITEKLHKEAEDDVRKEVDALFPRFPSYPTAGYEEADLWITLKNRGVASDFQIAEMVNAVKEALIQHRLPSAREAKVNEFMELVRNTQSRIDELELRQ